MKIETEKHLNNLIKNQIEENTNLEYKNPEALRNKSEIAKDISAMANSNGGIIIYGLCEENRDHKPTKIEWIENHQQKERIEQILQANVTPKIDLQIKTISNTGSSKFILAVNVPKSETAPHQDHSDKDRRIYWRRNGYTTREMEHYEVEDLFFKRKRPILEIKLEKNRTANPSYNVVLVNNGKVMGEKIMIQVIIPSVFQISDVNWEKKQDLYSPRNIPSVPPGAQYTKYIYFQDKFPVFPKVPFNSGIIYHPTKKEIHKVFFGFLVTCKDMELKKGIVTIEGDESTISFTDEEEIPFPPWPIYTGF